MTKLTLKARQTIPPQIVIKRLYEICDFYKIKKQLGKQMLQEFLTSDALDSIEFASMDDRYFLALYLLIEFCKVTDFEGYDAFKKEANERIAEERFIRFAKMSEKEYDKLVLKATKEFITEFLEREHIQLFLKPNNQRIYQKVFREVMNSIA